MDALPQDVYDGAADFDLAGALADVAVTPLDGLADTLAAAGLATVTCDTPQPWLRVLRYERSGETYLMFFNEHPHEQVRCRVALPDGTAIVGTRLDPLNGTAPVAFDGTLELAGGESCLVALGSAGGDETTTARDRDRDAALELAGPWSVALAPAGGDGAFGPEQNLDALVDLTAKCFPGACGTFRYRTTFGLDQSLTNATLDLGDVFECATVTLDEHPLGTRICAPYTFELGDLAADTHELTVDVINTLDHAVPDIFTLTEAVAPSGILGPARILV